MRTATCLLVLLSLGAAAASPLPADPASGWEMTQGRVNFAFASERAAAVNTLAWSTGLRLAYERGIGASAQSGASAPDKKASVALAFDLGRASDRAAGTHTTSPDLIDLDAKVLTVGGKRGGTYVGLTLLSDHDWSPQVVGLGYGYQYQGSSGLRIEGGLQATKDIASSITAHIGYRVGSAYQLGLGSRCQWRTEARAQGAFGTTLEDQRFLDTSIFYSLAGNLGVTARLRLENVLQQQRGHSLAQILLTYDLSR